ncbi:hypothetical protein ACFP81_07905 [Deinococcus lacus]|uniref:Uncharacterized protein n=1 Tax=Deinococcus lacus TaxID=392561 RepID=A0ABW1YCA2_9DEIO
MSVQARDRYVASLTEAESLLDEARAEYQAAQEVTASFGEEALSGLLDIFNMDGGNDGGGLFGALEPQTGVPEHSPVQPDPSQPAPAADPFAFMQTPPAAVAVTAPAETPPAPDFNPFGFMGTEQQAPQPAQTAADLPAHAWLIRGGEVTAGPTDSGVTRIAAILERAEDLGIHRLRFEDAEWSWGAERERGDDPARGWRLSRAADSASLELGNGGWLRGD